MGVDAKVSKKTQKDGTTWVLGTWVSQQQSKKSRYGFFPIPKTAKGKMQIRIGNSARVKFLRLKNRNENI